jgi:AcrR family transcriptional regulator
MLRIKTRVSRSVGRPAKKHAKPRKQPAQERSRETVAVTLEAAARVLERYGLEGYNTNAVALMAGVSIGSVYQYFPNKDSMTIALIQHFEAELGAAVQQALESVSDEKLEDTLRAIVRQLYKVHQRRPALHRLLESEEERLGSALPATAKHLEEMTLRRLRTHRKIPLAQLREEVADIFTVARAMVDSMLREGAAARAAERRTMRALRGYFGHAVEKSALS